MSIDYGRLTAKDRRETRRGVRLLRWNELVVDHPAGGFKWKLVREHNWEGLAWFYLTDAGGPEGLQQAADILESLLMTDRSFR